MEESTIPNSSDVEIGQGSSQKNIDDSNSVVQNKSSEDELNEKSPRSCSGNGSYPEKKKDSSSAERPKK